MPTTTDAVASTPKTPKAKAKRGDALQDPLQRQALPKGKGKNKEEDLDEILAGLDAPQLSKDEKQAAKRLELERQRLLDEQAAAAREAGLKQARSVQGRSLWRDEADRLLAQVPTEIKDKNVVGGNNWVPLLAATFADLKLKLETGNFETSAIVDEISEAQGTNDQQWEQACWDAVKGTFGTNAPIKEAFWTHLGWDGVKGAIWDLKPLGAGPSGTKIHLTVSGNSIPSPLTLVQNDPNALEKSPLTLFNDFFMKTKHNDRVHCTRESDPVKHIYLGGKNGEKRAIADDEWGGDAKFMHKALLNFQTDAIQKIVDAKLKGWKI